MMASSGWQFSTASSSDLASPTPATTSISPSASSRVMPFAQQDAVVRDHRPHGITASTRVGPPGGLVTRKVPSMAATRPARPARPPPGIDSGSAAPVILHQDPEGPGCLADRHRGPGGAGVLGHVRYRFGGYVVGRGLDGAIQPPGQIDLDEDRDGAAGDERGERGIEAPFVEH